MKNNKKSKSGIKIKKTGRILLRGIVIALVACVLIFAGIIVSDYIFSDNSEEAVDEIITVTVSGKDIILGDDKKVSLSELSLYLENAESKGELYTVALINDTDCPADADVYNSIVDMLAKYDIICEKITVPATFDEPALSTTDEIYPTASSAVV